MKTNTFISVLILLLIVACRNNSEKKLADVEKQELAKNIRHDSIFMGIHLGMPKQAFFDYCWQKNKEKLFIEGSGKTVEHQLGKEGFNFPLQMNFYPTFKDDKVSELPIQFTYTVLDPWNPKMKTEELLKEVKKLMEKWFGTGFFLTTLPDGKKVYAKVHGNKRIIIMVEKDFEVMVIVTDLMAANY